MTLTCCRLREDCDSGLYSCRVTSSILSERFTGVRGGSSDSNFYQQYHNITSTIAFKNEPIMELV